MKKLYVILFTVFLNLAFYSCTPQGNPSNVPAATEEEDCCGDDIPIPPPPPPGTGG